MAGKLPLATEERIRLDPSSDNSDAAATDDVGRVTDGRVAAGRVTLDDSFE